MGRVVAAEKTLTLEGPLILEVEPLLGIRRDDIDVEVDQMTVIGRITLINADTVRIMAGRTGGIVHHDMHIVGKALIGQKGGPTVALVAEGVAG